MRYEREISCRGSYDVIVCGGGVAGFAAAISAARAGAGVLLVEGSGCLGGSASRAGIHFLLGGRKLNPETMRFDRVVGGLFDELTDRLIAAGDALEPNEVDLSRNYFGWYPRMAAGIPVNAEGLKSTMEKMCAESGVTLLYFTQLIDAQAGNRRLSRIVTASKSGMALWEARCFVDCTGDGDLLHYAGCDMLKGRPEDGRTTAASVEMIVEHVDRDEMIQYQNQHQSPKFVEIVNRLKEEGQWPFLYDIVVTMQLTEPDVFLVNTCRQIKVDGTDADSLTAAQIDGREQNRRLFQLLKEHFPGFSNARIRYITDTVGIRESRRLNGRYMVTVEDGRQGRRYRDEVAATTYNWDLPDVNRPSYDPMMGNAATPDASMKKPAIYLPYRCLLPRELDNAFTAGRCISVEREVLGPARIIGPAMHTGQAAGTAAAMVALQNISSGALDTVSLQNTLRANGWILP